MYTYTELKQTYRDFQQPVIVLEIEGKDFAKNESGFVVSDIEVDLTCGFEASIASFSFYNTFDTDGSRFRIDKIKEYIMLGSSVKIALGYGAQAREVFYGYIARVNFQYEAGSMPGIRVTAMDVKGAMMASNYSRQIRANTYSAAVKEIFGKNIMAAGGGISEDNKAGKANYDRIIRDVNVEDTPDKSIASAGKKQASDYTVEMVAESDYEFVVKAAKRFNYEFFIECGNVYFRKAKNTTETLMEMGPGEGLLHFDVEYDITGLVSGVEARGMDVSQGKLIQSEESLNRKISIGNHAKKIIGKSKKVYLDASIRSKEDAQYRAKSLVEEIAYRLGTMECECIGMPELMPGKFFILKAMGTPPENQFYLHRVIHKMNQEEGFLTKLYGKAASIQQ